MTMDTPTPPTEAPKCPECGSELIAYRPPEQLGSWFVTEQGSTTIVTRCPTCVRDYHTPMNHFPADPIPDE